MNLKNNKLIRDLKDLKALCLSYQSGDKKIVMTNGCFDILHAGHVTYLEKAKNNINYLILGLNSDSSVKKLKGVDRPVINQNDRARVLCSLEAVDAVIIFDEETPIKLIESIRPDFLIKGSDYKIDEVVGHKEIKKWGGKVKLIELLKGRSSSNIINNFNTPINDDRFGGIDLPFNVVSGSFAYWEIISNNLYVYDPFVDTLVIDLQGDVTVRAYFGEIKDIVFDVKSSKRLAEVIRQYSGRPVMCKTGHSHVRKAVQQNSAPLGGEFSGHIFFNDRWKGFDDGPYAAVRLLEILCADPDNKTLDAMIGELDKSSYTPEILIPIDEADKFSLMATVAAGCQFNGAEIITPDGLRVEYVHGWGLIRASNTSASLTLRFEADDDQALEDIKQRFRQELSPFINNMEDYF